MIFGDFFVKSNTPLNRLLCKYTKSYFNQVNVKLAECINKIIIFFVSSGDCSWRKTSASLKFHKKETTEVIILVILCLIKLCVIAGIWHGKSQLSQR